MGGFAAAPELEGKGHWQVRNLFLGQLQVNMNLRITLLNHLNISPFSSYCYVRKKDCAESRVKWTKTENKAAALLCSFRVNTNRWSWLLHLAQAETLPGPSSEITLTPLLQTLSLGLSKSKVVRP